MINTETFYFGIMDNNSNQTTFCLLKDTDNESFTDFQIEEINGVPILNEDLSVVEEVSIDLTSYFGDTREFDSVKGETLFIKKLSEKEYYSFLS